jgi:hypothetical protein
MRSGVSVAQSISDLPSLRAANTPSSPSYTLEDAARSDSIKYIKSACKCDLLYQQQQQQQQQRNHKVSV